jgi:hypothetical protein
MVRCYNGNRKPGETTVGHQERGERSALLDAPNIEGTCQPVRRELPDGKTQFPPALKGLLTFTSQFRNFSVIWKDEKGKYFAECYVARYTLSKEKYTETQEYLIIDDQIGGKGVRHDLSNALASSPVTIEGNRIRLALPQPFEQALNISVEFAGGKLKATGKDLFVDYWEKVA